MLLGANWAEMDHSESPGPTTMRRVVTALICPGAAESAPAHEAALDATCHPAANASVTKIKRKIDSRRRDTTLILISSPPWSP